MTAASKRPSSTGKEKKKKTEDQWYITASIVTKTNAIE
jgi:hypothetical protein